MSTLSTPFDSISISAGQSLALVCDQDLSALPSLLAKLAQSHQTHFQLSCFCLSAPDPLLLQQLHLDYQPDSLNTPRRWTLSPTSGSHLTVTLTLNTELTLDGINELDYRHGFEQLIIAADANDKLAANPNIASAFAGLCKPMANISLLQQDDILATSLTKTIPSTEQVTDITSGPYPAPTQTPGETAIIGGGIASAALCLSLAERGVNMSLFCRDAQAGEAASGNRQGALYPLLSQHHDELSQFYVQSFLYCRFRLAQMLGQGHEIAHGFSGVLQTAHDDKSTARLDKVMQFPWPDFIARPVNAETATSIAGIDINKPGLEYPLGAWVCPAEYTRAMIAQAAKTTELKQHYQTQIDAIERREDGWYLSQSDSALQYGPFANLILANGAEVTALPQTSQLPLSPFRGQVSHVPTTARLSQLNTVLCAEGYMTPANNQAHCIGASYVKSSKDLSFSETEQQANKSRVQLSYPGKDWVEDIDVSGNSARVGVRMVSRDHFPMMGAAPDTEHLFELAAAHPQDAKFWQAQNAPVYQGLFILGGFGSRGVCSAPLTAEALAAQLCGEISPFNQDIRQRLNPNRVWMRKLLKGKPL